MPAAYRGIAVAHDARGMQGPRNWGHGPVHPERDAQRIGGIEALYWHRTARARRHIPDAASASPQSHTEADQEDRT
jgi:hypothetical protein